MLRGLMVLYHLFIVKGIALYDKETYYSDWNNKPKPIAIYGETDPFDDEDK
jgi:hypothetical protein